MGATSGAGLSGKSVVVTGAASGIGRAAALRFAAEGAEVVVADLNADGAESVVDEIRSAGGTAVAVAGDLSDGAVVDEVVATAVDAFGGVDVLVNNAGVMDSMSAPVDVTDAEWDRVLRINLTAPFLLTRAVLPHMLSAGVEPSSTPPPRRRCAAARRAPRTPSPSTASSASPAPSP